MTSSNIFGKGIVVPGLGNVKIRFNFKGRTTNVKVFISQSAIPSCEIVHKGWSRRSLEDRDNRSIGRREALAKALKYIDSDSSRIIWEAVFTQSSKMARLRQHKALRSLDKYLS